MLTTDLLEITDLSPLGLLKVSGPDAKRFLQGQFTCNLDEISVTHSTLGAHCNPQGRIISLFRIFLYHDDYYLQMPKELIPTACTALKKYAIFFKVLLSDATDTVFQLGWNGRGWKRSLILPHQINEQMTHEDVTMIKLSESRYLMLARTPDALPSSMFTTKHFHSFQSWKKQDLAEGIASIYPESSEKFLPHDINLPHLNGVSFNKGCYTGQEIIARMQYRGKLKYQLVRAHVNTTLKLARGGDLYVENKPCGTIVDYALLTKNSYDLLIITQDIHLKANHVFIDLTKTVALEFDPLRVY